MKLLNKEELKKLSPEKQMAYLHEMIAECNAYLTVTKILAYSAFAWSIYLSVREMNLI